MAIKLADLLTKSKLQTSKWPITICILHEIARWIEYCTEANKKGKPLAKMAFLGKNIKYTLNMWKPPVKCKSQRTESALNSWTPGIKSITIESREMPRLLSASRHFPLFFLFPPLPVWLLALMPPFCSLIWQPTECCPVKICKNTPND